ncbi:MAG: tRNA (adenosine(37)-N6)-threonylcarbamoyltransferase complex dimerization subunit type 1 TsaB [Planctomycetia bacterium]
MRALILETSGGEGEVGLVDDGRLVETVRPTAARKHARDLLPMVQHLLRNRAWKASDLELIVVDVGPGSYTGLRVGIMAAKMLAYVSKTPVVAVDALTVAAHDAPADAATVSAVADAQQTNVYTALFTRNAAGSLTRSLPSEDVAEVKTAADWAAGLAPEVYAAGPGLDRFAALLPPGVRFAAEGLRAPTAAAAWHVAECLYTAGRRDDPWALEPLYLRKSSAELKWENRRPPTAAGST